ncbi:unnamed protein product [Orchesella dallaii]|uniref:Uncharacterized protein n=1 Tax=Orchesella dallaii TaxID=48710 RepID=A0ABP1PRY4_9HEXA
MSNNNDVNSKPNSLVLEQSVQTKQFRASKYPLTYYNSAKSLSTLSTNTLRRRTSRSNGKIQRRKSKHGESFDKNFKTTETLPKYISSGTYIAKAIIEKALQKIDGVLSDFTERTMSKLDVGNGQLPNRLNNDIRLPKTRPRTGTANLKSHDQNQRQSRTSSGRLRKSDILSKLPPHIIELMRMDSSSSVTKSKDRKYHSTKMTLKQAGNNTGQDYTPKCYSKSFKISIVSVPLHLEIEKPTKTKEKYGNERSHEPYKLNKRNSVNLAMNTNVVQKQTEEQNHTLTLNKNDKNIGTTGSSYKSSFKKTLKSQIGVENGVAFVMGTKVKQQYYNSFGDAKDYG